MKIIEQVEEIIKLHAAKLREESRKKELERIHIQNLGEDVQG